MRLEDLLLKKEELPILFDCCFQIPIHQKLLDPSIQFGGKIANEVFSQVAIEWYEDLSKYAETLTGSQTKTWIKDVFLKKKPRIKREYGRQVLNEIWEDQVILDCNGFARSLSINRNVGGTLYFNHEKECETCIPLRENGGRYMQFSENKIKEFSKEIADLEEGKKGAIIDVYLTHNIDYYPGALFLRNWAIAYMNEVFRKHRNIFEK